MALILVADDNEAIRKLIGDVARAEGHAVTAVADGRAALDACMSAHYEVVIADLQMPEMTGGELIGNLRAIGYCARFCIMSGSFGPDVALAQTGRVFGADIAIAKPFGVEQFVQMLKSLTTAAATRASSRRP